MLDLAIAIPTFIGSVLSMFAAGFIFTCYVVLPSQKHFRHTLILNLACADFFNAMNNSISGIYAFTHVSIPPGAACSLNGLIGQWTVQATDFSILFISIATVITLRNWNYEPKVTRTTKILISMGIWFVPTITSFTGLALNAYQPVSGNWCWLSSKDPILRYALGHAWRLTIIFTIICLFSYLFIYMHRHFASLRSIDELNALEGDEDTDRFEERAYHGKDGGLGGMNGIYVYNEFEVFEEPNEFYWNAGTAQESRPDYLPYHQKDLPRKEDEENITPPLSPIKVVKQTLHPHSSNDRTDHETRPLLTRDPLALVRRPPPPNLSTTISSMYPSRTTIRAREAHIQKLLLLNAYPVAYIILWIPGILNRFIELTGHKSRTVAILQASTQFVGLANALVYGYNERIWDLTKLWWRSRADGGNSKRRNSRELKMETQGKTLDRPSSISWPIGRPAVPQSIVIAQC